MRKFQTTDIFELGRVLMRIGVREEIQEAAKRAEESKNKKVQIDMGFDLFFGILSKAIQESAEIEIYKFLANIFECEWEEVGMMDPFELWEKINEVASIEKWKSFFKLAAKSIPKK